MITMGIIDDIRIYDRALSEFEVKALYELGEQPVQESGSGTTTVVNGTVADGSIAPSKLSSEVSNALKPVVVGQPSSVTSVDEQFCFWMYAAGEIFLTNGKRMG